MGNEKEAILEELVSLKEEFIEKSRQLNDAIAEIEIKEDAVERSNAKVSLKADLLWESNLEETCNLMKMV